MAAFKTWKILEKFSNYLIKTPHGIVFSSNVFSDIFEIAFYIWTGTILLKKSAWKKIGLFRTDIFGHEDTDMWICFVRSCSIGYVDEPLAFYKQFRSNLTIKNPIRYAQDRLNFLNQILKEYQYSAKLNRMIKKRISWVYYDLAIYYQRQDGFALSILNFFKSIYNYPYNTYVYQSMLISIIPNRLKQLLKR